MKAARQPYEVTLSPAGTLVTCNVRGCVFWGYSWKPLIRNIPGLGIYRDYFDTASVLLLLRYNYSGLFRCFFGAPPASTQFSDHFQGKSGYSFAGVVQYEYLQVRRCLAAKEVRGCGVWSAKQNQKGFVYKAGPLLLKSINTKVLRIKGKVLLGDASRPLLALIC